MSNITLDDETKGILARSTITESSVILPKDLPRPVYLRVNKVLQHHGGMWTRHEGAHVFESDPREKLGLTMQTGVAIDYKKMYQAFYTPQELASDVVGGLGSDLTGKRALEPSAGGGALARELRRRGANVLCVELNPDAVKSLRADGFEVIEGDFLSVSQGDIGSFDVIAMNPPFSGNQDCKHVTHAFDKFLAPGGRMVAIAGTGFTFSTGIKSRNTFRDFIEAHGRYIMIPEGSFQESGTPIATVLITLDKPGTAPQASAPDASSFEAYAGATDAPTDAIEEVDATATKQSLDGINLQELLDSGANAADVGRQQYFTPLDHARAFTSALPPSRDWFVDLTMGAGSLLIASNAENLLGVDIDPRCARKPNNAAGNWNCATADLTKLYPLLEEIGWRFDLCGLNPPFSVKWPSDRLKSLARSNCDAVRATFKPGIATVDSTLAMMMIALDRMTARGEGYMVCNEATARRFFGDPDMNADDAAKAKLPGIALRSHIWLWLTVPPGVFDTVSDFNTAVIYFAREHAGECPFHLSVPDSKPATIAQFLKSIQTQRYVLRRGLAIGSAHDFLASQGSLFEAAKKEYAALYRKDADREYNIWLNEEGYIRRNLTPFQTFSKRIPVDEAKRLDDIHNQTPMALVVQKPTRLALLRAVHSTYWRVDPKLLSAVDEAILSYNAERAPLTPLNEVQRLGFLDEEDHIRCQHTGLNGFTEGKSYPIETSTEDVERNDVRPNILGVDEEVTLTGKELVIVITDDNDKKHKFKVAIIGDDAKNPHGIHTLDALIRHFAIPEVPDVAIVHAKKYEGFIAHMKRIEAARNFELGTLNKEPQNTERVPYSGVRKASPLAGTGLLKSYDVSSPNEPSLLQGQDTAPQPSLQHNSSLREAEGRGRQTILIDGLSPITDGLFHYRQYQFNDYARLAIHDGAIYGAEPGLGKTFAIYTMPQLKGAKRTLIVAPEGLHEQLIDEGMDKFGIKVKRLNSVADFYNDADLLQARRDIQNAGGTLGENKGQGGGSDIEGWWITSYSQLGYNGGDQWQGKEQADGTFLLTPKVLNARKCHPLYVAEHDYGIGTDNGGIRCLSAPTLSMLVWNLFDCVECDEGVRLKSTDSYMSLGVRQMVAQFRYLFTGTPIKNRLEDIFWLAWWVVGGHHDACARWPYANTGSAREEFADAHMLVEENLTRERKHLERMGYFKSFIRRTPRICNIHRLWKLLAGVVLSRRKCDIGEDIVPKTIIPIQVMPGKAQMQVYKWHCDHAPEIAKNGNLMNPITSIMAQLTNLRMAALCPDSPKLSSAHQSVNSIREMLAQEAGLKADTHGMFDAMKTEKAVKVARKGQRTPFAAEAKVAFELLQNMIDSGTKLDLEAIYAAAPSFRGKISQISSQQMDVKASRSWTDHNPKQAAILQLIHDLLSQGEQVVVLSPFEQFGHCLHQKLVSAGVSAVLLDGHVSPKMRGKLSKQFKRKVFSVVVGGIKAMSEGHSWENAAHLILPSLDWAYDVNRQAEDRVHRLVSLKPVNIYAMTTKNTIDLRLTDAYSEKGESSQLALHGEIFGDTKDELNLGKLLRECIRNFDPNAESVDELDIEQQWETSLKHKLGIAEQAFRQYHPNIIMDVEGKKVTRREVRRAVQATNGLVSMMVSIVRCVPDSTFGVLMGSSDPAFIKATREAFTGFCAENNFKDWRKAWKEFDKQRQLKPLAIETPAPAPVPAPAPRIPTAQTKSARDFLNLL